MKKQIYKVMYLGSSKVHGGIYVFQTTATNEKQAIKNLHQCIIGKGCIEKIIKVYTD